MLQSTEKQGIVVVVVVVVAHLWQRNGKLKIRAVKSASLALSKRIGKAERPRQMGSRCLQFDQHMKQSCKKLKISGLQPICSALLLKRDINGIFDSPQRIRTILVPSSKLTYPLPAGTFESMIFLFPRWDMDAFPGGYPKVAWICFGFSQINI